MKIIEAFKKIKELEEKRDDLTKAAHTFCAHMDFETPHYPDQKIKVLGWMQAIEDLNKEILGLTIRIQKTNLAIRVPITIKDNQVERTIAEWVLRKRKFCASDKIAWQGVGDKNLREGNIQDSAGTVRAVKIVRCYDQELKDKRLEMYSAEPYLIDAALEVANAVNDLME